MQFSDTGNRVGSRLFALLLSVTLAGGCGSSDSFVFTNTPLTPPTTTPVVQPLPVANDDTIPALGNSTLNQAAATGVLANDSVNNAQITAFDATSTQGGTVALAADGSFVYTPPFGFTGNDTFRYTLTNSEGESTATVTLVLDSAAWFVDTALGVNGDGSQSSPFNNLGDAFTAAATGDTVFVFPGAGTFTGTINLPAGIKLVGQGAGLALAQSIVPAGTAPVFEGPIVPEGNNTISGLLFDGGDYGVRASDVSNITITENTFRASNNRYVAFTDVGGSNLIQANTFEPIDNDNEHIDIFNTDTDSSITINDNNFSDTVNRDVDRCVKFFGQGTSVTTMNVSGNTFISDSALLTDLPIEEAIELSLSGTANATLTANGNTMTNMENNAIRILVREDASCTATLSQNIVTNTGEASIQALCFDTADLTLTIDNNSLNTSVQDGILIQTVDNAMGQVKAAIRNCSISGAAGYSIHFDAGNNSTQCADITGNTVDADIVFDPSAGATVNVERLELAQGGPLESVNTLNNATVQELGGGNVVSQNAGFCVIP